jgi:hypothetical protein
MNFIVRAQVCRNRLWHYRWWPTFLFDPTSSSFELSMWYFPIGGCDLVEEMCNFEAELKMVLEFSLGRIIRPLGSTRLKDKRQNHGGGRKLHPPGWYFRPAPIRCLNHCFALPGSWARSLGPDGIFICPLYHVSAIAWRAHEQARRTYDIWSRRKLCRPMRSTSEDRTIGGNHPA